MNRLVFLFISVAFSIFTCENASIPLFGHRISMALLNDSIPIIAYNNDINTTLYYAERISAANWSEELVEEIKLPVSYISLATMTNNTIPAIAAVTYNVTNFLSFYYKVNDTWIYEDVDEIGDFAYPISMTVLDSGNVVIGYYYSDDTRVRFAERVAPDNWTITTVYNSTQADVGHYISVSQIGNWIGIVYIVEPASNASDIGFYSYTSGNTTWFTMNISTIHGHHITLVEYNDNIPLIFYHNAINDTLEYTLFANNTWSSSVVIESRNTSVGLWLSGTTFHGYPAISYVVEDYEVHVSTLIDPNTETWVTENVNGVGAYQDTSIVALDDDSLAVAYYDTGLQIGRYCYQDYNFDTTSTVNLCGNGVLDAGEECDYTLSVFCTTSCTRDTITPTIIIISISVVVALVVGIILLFFFICVLMN